MADQTQNPGTTGASTRLDRADWLSFFVTTHLVFIGYLLTLAPSITLGWSGILTTSAMYGGVGPPQGYPVWTIYSWLFIKLLPFSNPAWRVAVGSAVAGALACGLVALIVSRSGKMVFSGMPAFERFTSREQNQIRGMAGYVAGMALGFSDAFWEEALIADFWTLSVCFFVLVIYLLMRWWETRRRRLCWLLFFVYGLLLTNSQEMIVALPGIASAVILIDRKLGRDISLVILPVAILATSTTQFAIWEISSQTINWPLLIACSLVFFFAITMAIAMRGVGSEWKSTLVCTALLLFGLSVYLYLPIASATNPPSNWGYSRTLGGFTHLVSRGQYEHIRPTTSISLFSSQLWAMTKQTIREFGWPYLLFAALPFCCLPRMTGAGRKWMGALFLIFICVGPLLIELYNPATDRQSLELNEQFFYTARIPLALWTGMGLILFASIVATPGPNKSPLPA